MTMRYRWALLTAMGCSALGQGTRMIIEYVQGDSWYRPNSLDLVIDWLPLACLGGAVLALGLLEFKRARENALA